MRKHVLRNALPPDHRGRRRPGRIPGRRPRRRRAPLQLPGHRTAHPRGRAAEGPAAADCVRSRDRHRLPRRHADRRHPVRGAQPAHPARGLGVSRLAGPTRAAPRDAGCADRAPAAAPPLAHRAHRQPRARLLGLLRPFPRRCSVRPDLRQPVPDEPAARVGPRVRNGHERPRHPLARARGVAEHPRDRTGGDAHRHRARNRARAHHGLLQRPRGRRRQPRRRRHPCAAADHPGDPDRDCGREARAGGS